MPYVLQPYDKGWRIQYVTAVGELRGQSALLPGEVSQSSKSLWTVMNCSRGSAFVRRDETF